MASAWAQRHNLIELTVDVTGFDQKYCRYNYLIIIVKTAWMQAIWSELDINMLSESPNACSTQTVWQSGVILNLMPFGTLLNDVAKYAVWRRLISPDCLGNGNI
jgi:hypothetical protein